jgi:integrase
MARKQPLKLPPYCSVDKYGYKLKRYEGRVNGKIKWGRTQIIAPADAPMSEVWRAYEEAVGDGTQTLNWLVSKYRDSDKFKTLSPKSQREYSKALEKLLNAPVGNAVFGSVALHLIDKRSIRSYLDTYPSPVAANRQVAVLKAAWNWAIQRYSIPDNPAIGVSLNREAPRKRRITQDEMNWVQRNAPAPIYQMCELAYLLRARLGEVLALTVEDVSQSHVRLIRSKGSEGEMTILSDRLRAALEPVRGGTHICHQYTEHGFRSAWARLKQKMIADGIEPFTFHDFKSMGCTEHPTHHSGHRSPAMRATYVLDLPEVPATR